MEQSLYDGTHQYYYIETRWVKSRRWDTKKWTKHLPEEKDWYSCGEQYIHKHTWVNRGMNIKNTRFGAAIDKARQQMGGFRNVFLKYEDAVACVVDMKKRDAKGGYDSPDPGGRVKTEIRHEFRISWCQISKLTIEGVTGKVS